MHVTDTVMSRKNPSVAVMVATLFLMSPLVSPAAVSPVAPGRLPGLANPVLPGYYADPSVVRHGGSWYVYATLDPWGGETLGCWESKDFRNWTYRVLNWPTKKACTSPTSKGAMVWAPSVVRAPDGRFAMYVSVGSEVWVGLADNPLGPWRDGNGGRPLIPENYKPGYHMIDAEGFIDDDGTAYLYWGSGHGWKNGKCWVVRLKPDLVTFDGEPKEVTPRNYFEAPFMLKHGGRYYLMYSQGVTIEDSYRVHYAIGDTPFGPFQEASNSPTLVTDGASNIVAPGHHAVFRDGARHYILYHRHSIPFDPKFIGRQTCVDELVFGPDGLIAKVTPTHEGPALVSQGAPRPKATEGIVVTASSQRNVHTDAARVVDDNYATLWAAGPEWKKDGAALDLDLGAARPIREIELRPEYAWKQYRLRVDISLDGVSWSTVADHTAEPVSGSPLILATPGEARHVRLVFPPSTATAEPALWEATVR